MTTNFQLEKYIERNRGKLKNRNFLGVFSSDKLPDNVSTNSCLIANYSPISHPSSGHWIAMGNLKGNGDAWYFDSYGFPPDADDNALHDTTDFKDFLIRNSSTGKYIYNNFDFQAYGVHENECGEYASTALLEDWGKNPNAPIFNKLKSISDGFQRDRFIKKYVGIRK